MAVDFDGTDDKIAWSATGLYTDLAQISVCVWATIDTLDNNLDRMVHKNTVPNNGWEFSVQNNSGASRPNSLQFWFPWSGVGQAAWGAHNSISTGKHHLCITYNSASAANDPVIYVDSVSKSVTEIFTPSGSVTGDTTYPLEIGGQTSAAFFDGIINSVLIYNRILSAAEILDAYNSKQFIPDYRGLVFAPALYGCAGGLAEGAAMGASNTVADAVSGALGQPSGSPLFKGDSVLTFGG